jgi:phospholipid/cholesterol/gamma-HCH transport system substrate-binding protein
MNDKSMRFRIGLFVLAALLLLAVLVTLFGSFPTLFKRENAYTVVFEPPREVPGVTAISTGTPVRRSGVRIGEVGGVELDDETGEVRVRILVEKRYTIRLHEQAQLVTGLLGGDTTLDIGPRPLPPGEEADRTPVEPGGEIRGVRTASVSSVLNQAAAVVPTTQETLDEMRKSMQRFERMAPQMESALKEYTDLAKAGRESIPKLQRTSDEIEVTARNWGKLGERLDVLVQTNQEKLVKTLDQLNDTMTRIATAFSDENQKNLATTLKNVRAASERLDSLTHNTDELLKETRKTIQHVNESVTRADETLTNIKQATKPFAERGDTIAKNLDESTDKLNKTLTDVRELMRVVGQEDGTFKRFISDPSLYNNLDSAACQVARMLPRVDRMLKDMEVFADKLARHPELLGARGAISPSSGLKEAPSSLGPFPHNP